MTPTLAMIVQREAEIDGFKPESIYRLSISCGGITALSDRFEKKQDAENILNVLKEQKIAQVTKIATIVADHIVLEAEDLGLSSCWLTYFDPEIIRNEFNIPSNLEPIAIIALGYADTEKASPDRHSKDRKALESLVCYETF